MSIYPPVAINFCPARDAQALSVEICVASQYSEAAPVWERLIPDTHFFLKKTWLEAVESALPYDMRLLYLSFMKAGRPVGAAICQIQRFRAGESLPSLRETPNSRCALNNIAHWLSRKVAANFKTDLVVCGNLLLTGEHGYYFDSRHVAEDAAALMLEKGLRELSQRLQTEGQRASIWLIKDILPRRSTLTRSLTDTGFTPFYIQPNMRMALPFAHFEKYLEGMSAKYRANIKRALNKRRDIRTEELSTPQLEYLQAPMFALYQQVVGDAEFNMVKLRPDYFLVLKKKLGQGFRVWGYFAEDRLLGFFSSIKHGDTTEAHFLGYDKNENARYQLYLNMLVDLVRTAIESQSRELILGRTAPEIKSSIGAEPEDYLCFIRAQNPLANKVAKPVLDRLIPKTEWKQRHPFRKTAEHSDPD
ncbi:MAG: GNAT family N-acetyltransferase [Saprospiraceae bacterium]